MTQIVHSSRRATRKKRTACENLFIVIVRGRGVLADMSDPFIAMLMLFLFCETIRYIALFPIYDISHSGLQRRGMLELTFRELKNGLRAMWAKKHRQVSRVVFLYAYRRQVNEGAQWSCALWGLVRVGARGTRTRVAR